MDTGQIQCSLDSLILNDFHEYLELVFVHFIAPDRYFSAEK